MLKESASILFLAAVFAAPGLQAEGPSLLLQSTGQFRNIGDQAHKPGAWRVFSLHFPEGTVDLRGVDSITRRWTTTSAFFAT
ncbi:MAG: hypothetical protein ACOCVJ_03730 [Verrucomicrobiota bacterium]